VRGLAVRGVLEVLERLEAFAHLCLLRMQEMALEALVAQRSHDQVRPQLTRLHVS